MGWYSYYSHWEKWWHPYPTESYLFHMNVIFKGEYETMRWFVILIY